MGDALRLDVSCRCYRDRSRGQHVSLAAPRETYETAHPSSERLCSRSKRGTAYFFSAAVAFSFVSSYDAFASSPLPQVGGYLLPEYIFSELNMKHKYDNFNPF